MPLMFIKGVGINEEVIEIRYKEVVQVIMKCVINIMLEGPRGIA